MVAITHFAALGAAIFALTATAAPGAVAPLDVNVYCQDPDTLFGWSCPSPGITAFCNKHGRYVDGRVCPKNTCCELDSVTGEASCSENACLPYVWYPKGDEKWA